jgi:hypothetical protein
MLFAPIARSQMKYRSSFKQLSEVIGCEPVGRGGVSWTISNGA